MSALPARRIASSALCAALLVGITGPVAMAADSARGHAHVAPGARLPGADARLAQIAKLNRGELTPVADLLNAVLDSNGLLPAAEARKLGAGAKAALAEAAAKDPRIPVTSTVVLLPAPAPALPALVPAAPERRAADPVTDLLDLVLGAVDSLLQAITSGVGGILPSVDGLLNGVDDLLAGLLGGNLLQDEPVSSTPSSTSSTSVSTTPEAVTYPAVTLLPPAQPTAS
ncbi:hypothetical protein [Streptomyces coeruleorubidus]|uniref:Secreted protein n=1 Tax=Streptomyces coeruleorubidus TaxID=116188 RepID=A0A5J6I0B4_STRC4|nr:hypothetical protein [Streptomyces coeruleorubidus]QEV25468.1 hypothetical protein CP976_15775 [Streptomyces coeruleorubidus]GGT50477.1 hypothetical protein GCM10010256_03610 [Streptomyces coeruleorubidus]